MGDSCPEGELSLNPSEAYFKLYLILFAPWYKRFAIDFCVCD